MPDRADATPATLEALLEQRNVTGVERLVDSLGVSFNLPACIKAIERYDGESQDAPGLLVHRLREAAKVKWREPETAKALSASAVAGVELGAALCSHAALIGRKEHWGPHCEGSLVFVEEGGVAVAECDSCGLTVGVTPGQQAAWRARRDRMAA